MLTRLRISLFVLLLAGLAACASSTSVLAPTAATERGITEPFFIQPERMAEKAAIVKSGARIDVVFIGDSITQNYEKPEYKPIWDKYFAPLHALNLGYGMDTSGATYWRIGQGELDGLRPRVTVLLLGTNDTNLGRSADETVAGLTRVIDEIRIRLPQTRILLIAIPPSARSPEKSVADIATNFNLMGLAARDPRIGFFDVYSVFAQNDGTLNTSLYVEQAPDKPLHPNPQGQALMAAAIEPVIKKMLETK